MAPSSDPWYGQGFKLLKGCIEHSGISFLRNWKWRLCLNARGWL